MSVRPLPERRSTLVYAAERRSLERGGPPVLTAPAAWDQPDPRAPACKAGKDLPHKRCLAAAGTGEPHRRIMIATLPAWAVTRAPGVLP